MYHFHPAILVANRQINHEAGHILRENLFVKLMTNAPQYGFGLVSQGLPVVAEDDSASRVTYSATEITLILGTDTLHHPPSILLFAGDDMNIFCRMLLRSNLSRHFQSSLSIVMRGVALTRTSIWKLLEPFRRLHSMASVSITGQIEDEYKSNLIAEMSKQAPGNYTVVQGIQNAMKEGDQAASIHDFSIAISKFKRAWEDNKDWYWTHHVTTAILGNAILDEDHFNTTFVPTRLAIGTKLAITYLKLENHSQAYEWIKNALMNTWPCHQGAGDRPRVAAYASIYSIAAQASEGLGLVKRAVEEMKEAVRHDPGDSKLATELLRLERKIQSGDGDL